MNKAYPKVWAQKNKKTFANKMITESGVIQHPEPAAFFMAGLPGAGKTEFTKNLVSELELKTVRIDMDEIASQIDTYDPMYADAFREAATDLLNAVYDKTLSRRVDFIMDGTFRSDNSIKNVIRALNKNYIIKVFFISQEPAIAWGFTRAREKVEKRAIDRAGFIQSYFDIYENIKKLDGINHPNLTIDLVVKNETNEVGEWHRNISITDIDGLVNTRYNKQELERMLTQ